MAAVSVAAASGFDCCETIPCKRAAPWQRWLLVDGTEVGVCPARLASGEGAEWLSWWQHYRSGAFPVAGGLLDQAQPYLEAMRLIDSWLGGKVR